MIYQVEKGLLLDIWVLTFDESSFPFSRIISLCQICISYMKLEIKAHNPEFQTWIHKPRAPQVFFPCASPTNVSMSPSPTPTLHNNPAPSSSYWTQQWKPYPTRLKRSSNTTHASSTSTTHDYSQSTWQKQIQPMQMRFQNGCDVVENGYNGKITPIATDAVWFLKKKSHQQSFELIIAFLLVSYYYYAMICN